MYEPKCCGSVRRSTGVTSMLAIHHCLSIPPHTHYPPIVEGTERTISNLELDEMRQKEGSLIPTIDFPEDSSLALPGIIMLNFFASAAVIAHIVLGILMALAILATDVVLIIVILTVPVSVLLIVSAILFTLMYLEKPKLANPEARQKKVAEVANMLFHQLAEQLSPEQVIGYSLLKQKINHPTPANRSKVYVFFKHLVAERKDLLENRQNTLQKVERLSLQGIESCRDQHNGGEAHLSQWKDWLNEEKRRIHAAYATAFTGLDQLFEQVCINPDAVLGYGEPQG